MPVVFIVNVEASHFYSGFKFTTPNKYPGGGRSESEARGLRRSLGNPSRRTGRKVGRGTPDGEDVALPGVPGMPMLGSNRSSRRQGG